MIYMGVKFSYEHYLNKVSSILVSHFKILLYSILCLQRLGKLCLIRKDIYDHLVQPRSEFTVNFSHGVCETSVTCNVTNERRDKHETKYYSSGLMNTLTCCCKRI